MINKLAPLLSYLGEAYDFSTIDNVLLFGNNKMFSILSSINESNLDFNNISTIDNGFLFYKNLIPTFTLFNENEYNKNEHIIDIQFLFGGTNTIAMLMLMKAEQTEFEDDDKIVAPPLDYIIQLMVDKLNNNNRCWSKFNSKHKYYDFLKEFSKTKSFFRPENVPEEPKPSDNDELGC